MESLDKAFDKKFQDRIVKKGGFEEDTYFNTRKIYPEIKSFIRQREKELLKKIEKPKIELPELLEKYGIEFFQGYNRRENEIIELRKEISNE